MRGPCSKEALEPGSRSRRRNGIPSTDRLRSKLLRSLKTGTGFKTLRPGKLFQLSGWILHEVRDRSDRELLSRRLRSYLDGTRRGRLHLPHRFPESVKALSYLSIANVRQVAYWVKPSMSGDWLVDDQTAAIMHRIAPGMIWTRTTETVSWAIEAVVKRLPRNAVPRVTRAVWPSSPDLFEIVEMSRQGRNCLIRDRIPLTVPNCLTKKLVRDNISVASRIVRQQIVGVRRGMGVPSNLTGYFRRYHDFLILTVRHDLPSSLVRFLLGLWIRGHTSLWLVEPLPYRLYLKRHRTSEFLREASLAKPIDNRQRCESVGSTNSYSSNDSFGLYEPRLNPDSEWEILEWITESGLWPTFANDKSGHAFYRPPNRR
jgi:hypothetical protein